MSNQPFPIPPPDRQADNRVRARHGHFFLDLTSPRHLPPATLTILVVNGLIFLLMLYAGALKSNDVLLDFGASYGPYLRRGEYWRLVMPMFLHLGWWHLFVNCAALYILGPTLERVYGYGRFALLYVAMGIGSSLLSMSMSNNVAAGASGAVFGIAGVMLATGFLHRDLIPRRWWRAFGGGIVPFIAVTLASGFYVKHVDKWGHLGGLLSGILLGCLIPPPRRGPYGLVPSVTGQSPVPSGTGPGYDALMAVPEARPPQAIVLLPLALVILSMGATVEHFQTGRIVNRLLVDGVRLRFAHQEARALNMFQEAARRAPDDERPHEMLGSLYLEQKQFDNAVREFEQAAQLTPGSPQPQLGLGLAYYLKGDHRTAQQIFEAAPHTSEVERLLADLYGEQKLYAEAIKHYQEALRLEPDMAVAHNNLAWLLATCDDPKFRDPRASLEHARRGVELTQWKEAGFIDTLAEAYYANGNYQEAVKTQTKALALDPHNHEFQEHMARYRKGTGT